MVAQLATRQDPIAVLKSFLLARADKMAPLLPERWKHERMVELVVTAAVKNPRLRECTAESIYIALRDCAAVGLEPCSPLQEAALVPYKNKKNNTMECQFQPMYRGLISAAKRTGEIKDVAAYVIYEGDTVDVDYGRDDMIHHKPLLTRKHSVMVAVWCKIVMSNGHTHYEIMLAADILPIKKRAMNRGSSEYNGPWISDEGEMWRKTVVKRAAKYCQPTQGQYAEALGRIIEKDNESEGDEPTVDATPVSTTVVGDAEPSATAQAAKEKVVAAQKRRRKPTPAETESQASTAEDPPLKDATPTPEAEADVTVEADPETGEVVQDEPPVEEKPAEAPKAPAKAAPATKPAAKVEDRVKKIKELSIGIDLLPLEKLAGRAESVYLALSDAEQTECLRDSLLEKYGDLKGAKPIKLREFIRNAVKIVEGE